MGSGLDHGVTATIALKVDLKTGKKQENGRHVLEIVNNAEWNTDRTQIE